MLPNRLLQARCASSLLLLILLAFLPATQAEFSLLADTRLKGCVVLEPPYVFEDPSRRTGFRGVAISYLERLADNLEFSYQLDRWNGTREELIRHFETCDPNGSGDAACICDIAVGAFTVTNERMSRVEFVWAFGHEDYHMVIRKSKLRVDDSENTWFLFSTFTSEVWVVIFCGVLLHAVGTMFFGAFRPTDNKLPGAEQSPGARHRARFAWRILRFPAAILFAYSHLLGHPFGEESNRTPSFHKTAWLVLGLTSGLFLLTVYEASLTVLLFESTKTSPFNTLDDLKECVISPERIAMVRGSASQEFWTFAINTTFYRTKCGWDQVGIEVDTFEDGFRYLEDGRADYFFDLEASILTRAHRDCELFAPVGEPFFSTSVAFFLPKSGDVELRDILSRETRDLRERDAFDSATVVALRTACGEDIEATVTVGKLGAFFVLYGIIWAVLLLWRLVFLWRRKSGVRGVESQRGGTVIVGSGDAGPGKSTSSVVEEREGEGEEVR